LEKLPVGGRRCSPCQGSDIGPEGLWIIDAGLANFEPRVNVRAAMTNLGVWHDRQRLTAGIVIDAR
jgi:hypothetical protein